MHIPLDVQLSYGSFLGASTCVPVRLEELSLPLQEHPRLVL